MADKKEKILIVEDEAPLLRILGDELTQEKFMVFEAKNGEEGLEIALREHPDLIMLDIMMPKMDGMTMLKKLREDPWGKDASVLILTNSENDALKTVEALRHRVYEFLVKTRWKLGDVVKRVHEKLGT